MGSATSSQKSIAPRPSADFASGATILPVSQTNSSSHPLGGATVSSDSVRHVPIAPQSSDPLLNTGALALSMSPDSASTAQGVHDAVPTGNNEPSVAVAPLLSELTPHEVRSMTETTAADLSKTSPQAPEPAAATSAALILRSGSVNVSVRLHGVPANLEVIADNDGDDETPLSHKAADNGSRLVLFTASTCPAVRASTNSSSSHTCTAQTQLDASTVNHQVHPVKHRSTQPGAEGGPESVTLLGKDAAATMEGASASPLNPHSSQRPASGRQPTAALSPRHAHMKGTPAAAAVSPSTPRRYAIPLGQTVPESEWE